MCVCVQSEYAFTYLLCLFLQNNYPYGRQLKYNNRVVPHTKWCNTWREFFVNVILLRTTCIYVFYCYLHSGVCKLVTSRKSFVNIWSRTTYMVRSQDGMDKVQKYLNTVIQLTIDLLYSDIFIVTIEIYRELSNLHMRKNYKKG